MRSTSAIPESWAMPRPRSWATSSQSTCSRRPAPATRPRKPPHSAPPSERSVTIRLDGARTQGRRRAMAAELEIADRPAARRRRTAARLFDNRQFLGWLFMLPAAAILLVFLAYPLGLGFWLGLTDTPIGEPGHFIGLGNFVSLAHDTVFWLAVFNTIFYTVVASILKFCLGLYLALLLNRRLPFKSLLRAVVLLPFVVPTVLSAIAFWWIYDPQFSIVSWALIRFGIIDHYIDFLGRPWPARSEERRV